ncbi:Uma2 family endonuclease [Streptodolium elevatio]|uniref:Uma2 family endonuclease n=1 Tax=Streptodolium elevatio TaxID=3157996 RepID=A0ABV3DY12_9ACTN
MSVDYADVWHMPLPAKAHDMWVRDELADYLHLPNDGTRVEIVGGEIVVSPGPSLNHNYIVATIQDTMAVARSVRSDFPWRVVQTTDLNLPEIRDGYIPDLIVMHPDALQAALEAQAKHVTPDDVALAVEVTSPSNAVKDREPGLHHRKDTKWNGYARTLVPHYLLIDCAPSARRITLYSEPDAATRRYLSHVTWKFGEPVQLPAPYKVEIDSVDWRDWDE